MAIKAVLHPRPKTDGTLSLTIRVTKGSRSSYLFLGYSISREQWDPTLQRVKKSHPNSTRLNNLIARRLAELSDISIEFDALHVDATPRAITSKVQPKKATTFFTQAESYLQDLKNTGKFNQYSANNPRIKRFRRFLEEADIPFSDITHGLLNKYRVWLQQPKPSGHVNGARTIVNHLMVIQCVFAYAIRSKLVDRKDSPFGKDAMRLKLPESSKVGLTREEVRALEAVELSKPAHHLARITWLLGYYFAGMRVSDLIRLKWDNLRDGRLNYGMDKNGKQCSLKVPAKAQVILAECDKEHELVLPYLRGANLSDKGITQRRTGVSTRRINSLLQKHVKVQAGITKDLTTHITRHTFAQLAEAKIPTRILQRLYQHSDIRTTTIYQGHFQFQELDDALDSVLDG